MKLNLPRAMFGLALASAWTVAYPQQPLPNLTIGDLSAASWLYENYIDPALEMQRINMRQETLAADGSRGYIFTPRFEVQANPYTGDRAKDSLVRLSREACNAPDVVVATAGPAKTYLIHHDQGIVTARSFKINQVIAGSLAVGQEVTTVSFGGTLQSGADTLTVWVEGARPPIKGKLYLLFLAKIPGRQTSAFFTYDYAPDLVVANRLYRSPHSGDDIVDAPHGVGESLTKFKLKLTRALADYVCR